MMKKITLLIILFMTSLGYAQSLPFNFSDANQLMTGDGGTATSIVDDGGNDVLQMVGATAAWDNAQIVFAENLDLSDDANNTITFRIKPVNGTGSGVHLLKFESPASGGDQELEFTTTGTDWQNISLDFPAGLSNYGKMVIFTDKGDANASVSDTYLIDDIAGGTNITGTPPAVALPFNFSEASQLMSGDGGTTTSIVDDGGNDVLQMIGATAAWDNAQINFTQNLDLSDDANNTITFRIKPVNGTGSGVHLLKFESPASGGDQELEFTTTGTDWQNISLDFGAGLSNYGKMVIFTDKGDANASVSDTYLIDDIAGGTNITPPADTPPTVAAPTPPARNAWDVVSIFSDAYTSLTVDNWGPDWGASSARINDVTVDGGAVKVIDMAAGKTFAGIDFAANLFDASAFTHFHVDYYVTSPPAGLVFNTKLSNHNGGAGETSAIQDTQAVTADATWVSLDLSLDTFTAAAANGLLDRNAIAQIIISAARADGNIPVKIYFDNMYFYRAATASVSDNELLNVSMYPNPTSSRLNISAQSTIKMATIFNVFGKQVMSLDINKNSESIDVSNLSSGIYLIKYSIDNAVGTAKFIKQ